MESKGLLAAVPASVSGISILLTQDCELRQLNAAWRGKDCPTDILSFPQIPVGKGSPSPDSLGDIAISVDRTAAQGRAYGHSFNRELQRLLIHGILHLLGYDHEGVSSAEARRMRILEKVLAENVR